MSDEASQQPRSKKRCIALALFYKTVYFFICVADEPSLQDMQDNNYFADKTNSI